MTKPMFRASCLGLMAAVLAAAGCGGGGGTSGGGGTTSASGRIAFSDIIASGNADVKVNPISTGAVTSQAPSPQNEWEPSLNANGGLLAMISDRTGSRELYRMRTNNDGSLLRLTNNALEERDPAFTPTGDRIYFSQNAGGPDLEIMRINEDGSGLVQVTDNGVDDVSPAVSPDGEKLAYVRKTGATTGTIRVRTIASGAEVDVLGVTAANPTVSWQDNGTLLFTTTDAGQLVCAARGVSGGSVRIITTGFDPKISAGGGRIIFGRTIGGVTQAFTAQTDGGDVRQYTNTPGGVLSWDWSR